MSGPVLAKVHASSDAGFVVRHAVMVPASPDDVWARLVTPSQWWSAAHTFSKDASNLTLDALPGGCFCERLPDAGSAGSGVEHMRVVYVEKPRALRLSGALGPLQAEALQGSLTVFLRPGEAGTQVLLEYVVGGYMRRPVADVAAGVDKVLGEQLARLGAGLGARPRMDTPEPAEAPDTSPEEEPAESDFDREMEAAMEELSAPEAPPEPVEDLGEASPADADVPVFESR